MRFRHSCLRGRVCESDAIDGYRVVCVAYCMYVYWFLNILDLQLSTRCCPKLRSFHFALCYSMIGLANLRHFRNQSDTKLKPTASHSRFSRFTPTACWLRALCGFILVVIGCWIPRCNSSFFSCLHLSSASFIASVLVPNHQGLCWVKLSWRGT